MRRGAVARGAVMVGLAAVAAVLGYYAPSESEFLQRGPDRIAAGLCHRLYADARTAADSARVDSQVPSSSNGRGGAGRRCGVLLAGERK